MVPFWLLWSNPYLQPSMTAYPRQVFPGTPPQLNQSTRPVASQMQQAVRTDPNMRALWSALLGGIYGGDPRRASGV